MELANMIYVFFGFETLTMQATFTDLLACMLKVGCGLWVTAFVIRSMLLALTIPDSKF